MRTVVLSGAVLALLVGDCFAQASLDVQSGAAPSASTRSQYTPPPHRPVTGATVPAAKPTTSKIAFQSRPSGAKITLSDGKSCVAPCSITVGFNESFTAVATKRGFRAKEFLVSPSYTDRGTSQIIGSAIQHGAVGLVVGLILAERAHKAEPIIVELIPGEGGPVPVTPTRQATSDTTMPGPENAAAKRDAAASASPVTASARAAQAKISCGPTGCVEVKPGCRVVEQQNVSSSSATGGGGAFVVCR